MHLQPIVKMTVKFLAGFEANVERFLFCVLDFHSKGSILFSSNCLRNHSHFNFGKGLSNIVEIFIGVNNSEAIVDEMCSTNSMSCSG